MRVPPVPTLSDDAKLILLSTAQGQTNEIHRIAGLSGLSIQVHNHGDLCQQNDPRSEARWDAALQELLTQQLIHRVPGHADFQVFKLTHDGYRVADAITQSE